MWIDPASQVSEKNRMNSVFIEKLFLLFLIFSLFPLFAKEKKRKLIVLSIDGYPGYYSDPKSEFYKYTPNLNKLKEVSDFSNKITSVYPTMTYPAHTSMVTGVDPEIHRIRFNSPVDPFGKNLNGWMWYAEDIKVKTIADFAKTKNKKTASVYWPVTAGADIDFNIPQYWRGKNIEDEKILKLLSTKGLYEEISQRTKIIVSEITTDAEKVRAGIYIWKNKKPDVLFIYTTDLDTAHHAYGIYSEKAKEKLIAIDSLVKELMEETQIYEKKNIGFIVVSDHGFKEIRSMCYPNSELKQRGLFLPEKESWRAYFKTLGGFSVLLENDSQNFSLSKKDLSNLKESIESKCKDTTFLFEGKNFEKLKNKFHSKGKAFLYSTKETGFGEKSDEPVSKHLDKSFANHGFLPIDPSMKTILVSYPKKDGTKLKSIKDVFKLSCAWLQIDCTKGEKKN